MVVEVQVPLPLDVVAVGILGVVDVGDPQDAVDAVTVVGGVRVRATRVRDDAHTARRLLRAAAARSC